MGDIYILVINKPWSKIILSLLDELIISYQLVFKEILYYGFCLFKPYVKKKKTLVICYVVLYLVPLFY